MVAGFSPYNRPQRKVPLPEPDDPKLPSNEDLFVKAPLYRKYPIQSAHYPRINSLIRSNQQIDCYCPKCGEVMVFKTILSMGGGAGRSVNPIYNGEDIIFSHLFQCAKNGLHQLRFVFLIENGKLFKIGQYPSTADLAGGELKKYLALLGENADEFKTAITLSGFGVGVGSLVYLRRIIEHLLETAHEEGRMDADWNEEAYNQARFVEKLKMLDKRLPDFLTENAVVYGILSKGVHRLSENECVDAFPVLKMAIESILDDKLVEMERQKKRKSVQAELQKLSQKHGSLKKHDPKGSE